MCIRDSSNRELLIDGTGLHLLPGAIDPHVHFREPGNTDKEDLQSGSRAAVAGGVTAFLDMPNNVPNATNRATLEAKIALAESKTVNHFGFFAGATRDNVRDYKISKAWTEFAESRYSWEVAQGTYLFMNKKTWKIFLQILVV